MDFLSQIVGFIIVFFIFFFPVIIRLIEKSKQKANAIKNRPKSNLSELRNMQTVRQSKKPAYKPAKVPSQAPKKTDFHSSLESFKQKNRFDQYHLDTHFETSSNAPSQSDNQVASRSITLRRFINETNSLKKIVIYHAIFDKPKALKWHDEN